jgi:hypothetical protein
MIVTGKMKAAAVSAIRYFAIRCIKFKVLKDNGLKHFSQFNQTDNLNKTRSGAGAFVLYTGTQATPLRNFLNFAPC